MLLHEVVADGIETIQTAVPVFGGKVVAKKLQAVSQVRFGMKKAFACLIEFCRAHVRLRYWCVCGSRIVPAGGHHSASAGLPALIRSAKKYGCHSALAGGDVEVVHGGDGKHVATVRAAGHEKYVRGGRA